MKVPYPIYFLSLFVLTYLLAVTIYVLQQYEPNDIGKVLLTTDLSFMHYWVLIVLYGLMNRGDK